MSLTLPLGMVRRLRRRVGGRNGGGDGSPFAPLRGLLPRSAYTGLAQVVSDQPDGRVRVRLHDSLATEVVAEWAIPYSYSPELGDTLWVIGDGERSYVLGVARGRGRSRLWFVGDAALRATRALKLQGDRGLRLVGQTLQVRTGRWEAVAQKREEVATEIRRAVRGLYEQVCGRVQRVTSGEESVVAGSITVMARGSVTMDGDVLMLS